MPARASDRDGSSADQTAQIFLDMWRDGRKYKCFLHVLAQTVSELPAGILSSCNNGFFGQTKNDRDRQAVLAHIARNTKGFVNSEYDRFIARMPVGMAIAKLGYTADMLQTEPYLVEPLMLATSEPSDEEIRAWHSGKTVSYFEKELLNETFLSCHCRACPPGLHPDLSPCSPGWSSPNRWSWPALDLTAGTRLTADLLEVRTLPGSAIPDGAYTTLAEAEGKVLTTARVAGDPITAYVAGESTASSGIPAQLAENTVAISIKVDQATGLAGVLRPGQTVTVIAIIDPASSSRTRCSP